MSKQVETHFTAYSFSDEEYANAVILTELQRMYVQTELSVAAQEKLQEQMDVTNLTKSAIRHAYLQGKMEAFEALLVTSENAKTELLKAVEEVVQGKQPPQQNL